MEFNIGAISASWGMIFYAVSGNILYLCITVFFSLLLSLLKVSQAEIAKNKDHPHLLLCRYGEKAFPNVEGKVS